LLSIVEQREVTYLVRELKANAHGPDLFQPERRLLADEFSLVPGLAPWRGSNELIHDWLLLNVEEARLCGVSGGALCDPKRTFRFHARLILLFAER
jgi:hypothetical protein